MLGLFIGKEYRRRHLIAFPEPNNMPWGSIEQASWIRMARENGRSCVGH
jgi:hypothetical protein